MASALVISPALISITVGSTLQLSAVPASGVKWYCDHCEVASVSSAGILTAHLPGTCTIRARRANQTASIAVVVNAVAAPANPPAPPVIPPPVPGPNPPPLPPPVGPPPVVPPNLPPPTPPPDPPPVGPRTLLTSTDLEFLGWLRFPRTVASDNGDGTTFSKGGFAIRKVAGVTRAFMNYGNGSVFSLLDEVILPDSGYTPTLTTSTPIATPYREWGTVFAVDAPDGFAFGRVGAGIDTYIHGLYWEPSDQTLWWQMGTAYGGVNSHYVSLGAVRFNDSDGTNPAATPTTYGRWRTTAGSQQTRGFMTRIPDWYAAAYTGGRRHAVGAQMASGVGVGDTSSPFGVGFHSVTLPDPTSPGDSTTTTTQQSAPTTPLILFPESHKMPRPGQYRGLDGPYGGVCPTGSLAGTSLPGLTIRTDWLEEVDDIGTGVWIDTGTKHGVVWFGQLLLNIPGYTAPGDPDGTVHGGYGDPFPAAGYLENGTTPRVQQCCHGQNDPTWQATGPWGHAMVPYVFIADPMQFTAVIGGTPWATPPTEIFRMNDLVQFTTHPSGRWSRRWTMSAAHDAEANRLYVPVKDVDSTRAGNPQWALAVFRVVPG